MTNELYADIIIPTRGRGELILQTIASIRASTYREFTLWIVDQSDDDTTARAVDSHLRADSRIKYVHVFPQGSSSARNAGVIQSNAPFILFTDDDCRVTPEWIDEMLGELRNPQTWSVFGRILPDTDESHNEPESTKGIWLALKDSPTRQVYANNRFNLGFGHGANMGFRRERYTQLGGFDEMLGVGARFRSWPERDVGYRILAAGGQIVYTPKALVYHRHWRAWDGVQSTLRNYAIGTGAAIGKYVRCGDWQAWFMLIEWILDQGVRPMISGAFKWHSWQKMYGGWLQIIYPWVGLVTSWRVPIDRSRILYRHDV
jgi:glycosyltransferase involved in cell wall biosynthesis